MHLVKQHGIEKKKCVMLSVVWCLYVHLISFKQTTIWLNILWQTFEVSFLNKIYESLTYISLNSSYRSRGSVCASALAINREVFFDGLDTKLWLKCHLVIDKSQRNRCFIIALQRKLFFNYTIKGMSKVLTLIIARTKAKRLNLLINQLYFDELKISNQSDLKMNWTCWFLLKEKKSCGYPEVCLPFPYQ